MELKHLKREWAALAAVCAALLAGGYALLASAWPGGERIFWAGPAGAVLVHLLAHLRGNLAQNHPPGRPEELFASLGLANWITLLRAGFLALLAGFLLLPRPEGTAAWAPGALYMSAAVLDFMDGWAARASRRTTALGEALDMHWDGFGVLAASLLLVRYGQVPPWYLLVGLARYLYLFGLKLRERAGLVNGPLPPSKMRRALAGLQMGFIAVAMLPVFTPPATWAAATAFMLPLLAGFVRDFLAVSGELRPSAAEQGIWNTRLKGWLPLALRAGSVGLLAAVLGREMFTPAPDAAVLTAGLAGMALIGLGAAGRVAALAIVLLSGFALRAWPLDGLYWAVLLLHSVLMFTGTGPYSIWKPEDWLIDHRAGEARLQR